MNAASDSLDTPSIIAEVEAFYQTYIDAFNEGDLDVYCECFDAKGVFLKRDVFNVVAAGPALAEHSQALRSRFIARGWASTDILARQVWLIEPEMAMVVADLRRVDRTGSEYERARCIYLVVRVEGRWRIRSSTVSTQALATSDGLLTGRA